MTDKEIEKLNEGRILREAGRALLPLLADMKSAVTARIIAAHRTGDASTLPAEAAELTVITELETRITQNNYATARREEKLNEHTSKHE